VFGVVIYATTEKGNPMYYRYEERRLSPQVERSCGIGTYDLATAWKLEAM
jgi:hypothetical protein